MIRSFALSSLVLLVSLCGCARSAKPDLDRAFPEGSDAARLQGKWALEAMELGDGKSASAALLKNVWFEFTGNRCTCSIRGLPDDCTFELTESDEPKRMRLRAIEEIDGGRRAVTKVKGPDGVYRDRAMDESYLYKFDGEQLVLAVALGGGPVPDSFEPRQQPTRIALLRLKKVQPVPQKQ